MAKHRSESMKQKRKLDPRQTSDHAIESQKSQTTEVQSDKINFNDNKFRDICSGDD